VALLLALAGDLSDSKSGPALAVAGGEYAQHFCAYWLFVGFLIGWTSLAIGLSAAIAAGTVSFTTYRLQLSPLDDKGGIRSPAGSR